jgi:PleD family two-component response regulator
MSPDKSVATQVSPDSVKSQLRVNRPAMSVHFLDPDIAGAERLANTLRSQHRVVVVGSASEALAQVDSRVPDLIVAEIDLPDADGLALVAR